MVTNTDKDYGGVRNLSNHKVPPLRSCWHLNRTAYDLQRSRHCGSMSQRNSNRLSCQRSLQDFDGDVFESRFQ